MALVTLQFAQPLNVSCQVGDTAYYVTTGSDGGFTVDDGGGITEIGTIVQITDALDTPTMIVRAIASYPGTGSTLSDKFILFSKDNKANISSPLGYFASVKLKNNVSSTTAGELHSVAMDIFESSK